MKWNESSALALVPSTGGGGLTRRQLGGVLATSAGLITLGPSAWGQGNTGIFEGEQANALGPARALPAELAKALAKNRPLVVMVSLNGCPYCKIARENYLLPLVRQDAVTVVQVDMLSKTSVLDFQGQASTHEQLVEKWKIRVAPSLLFFGRSGIEKADRLVGGYLPDFYGAYLQERLAGAQKSL